jgi:signal transduction histidine kinase
MGFKNSHITSILYALLASVAVSFLIFEWYHLKNEQNQKDIQNIASQSVEQSFNQFQSQIFEFSSSSTEFANEIAKLLISNQHLNNIRSIDSDFWGVSVYKEKKPIYWKGYTSTTQLDSIEANNTELQLYRVREGNVQFLQSIIPITNIQNTDTTYYQVYTRFLLNQQNEFSIGGNQSFDVELQINEPYQFPVRVSYATIRQDSVIHSRVFETMAGNFIALVYASDSDIDVYLSNSEDKIRNIRSYFILCIVILFTLLILWLTKSINIYLRLLLQWSFLGLIHALQDPFLPLLVDHSFVHLLIDVIFILLGYFCFFRFIKSLYEITVTSNLSEVYLVSFLHGVTFSTLVLYFLTNIYNYIVETQLNLFNQILTSSIESTFWIWIFGTSILIITLIYNISFNRGLTNNFLSSIGIFGSTIFGQLIPLLFGLILSKEMGIDHSIIWVSLMVILVLLALTFLQIRYHSLTLDKSLIRLLLFLIMLVASSITTIIYFSFDQVLYSKLETNTNAFEEDNEEKIQQVISDLLNEAYSEVRSISLYSVSNFEQIINELLLEDWLKYSFSVQLIDKSGTPLAAYNTNLSVPQWTRDYRIDELIIPYEEERIRKANVRPILRNQPINTVNAEYSYFMRGWIPVYQSRRSETISGWILATLYKEIPELNRPFRSVVNATIQSPEETAFTFTEYVSGIPTRSVVSGTLTSIPDYGVLPAKIQDYMLANTEWVQSSNMQNMKLKERFVQSKTGSVIRGTHQQVTIPQILYVFLRIYFTTAIPLILILVVLTSTRFWNTISKSRKIRDRIMDRSIIASVICLFLLIGATALILESQNKIEVQEALRDQLITLTETLSEVNETDQFSNDFLENITAVLGVDASLYSQGILVNSTTPPMYSQHLLPPTIPWSMYQEIVNEGAQLAIDILSIGDQELMIGYQPWLNSDNEIAGIVGIPTFLKTPDFYSRLLSTSSYLLAFYSLIFGVLILTIGLISTRITAPLITLEKGLEKISSGDLNTRIKVESNDEIGMLTQAYNSMAIRLKKLQNELAQNEREAAWKQMAQQVAHEIKNPLTPMKLNLQHLERQLQKTGAELKLNKPRVTAITKSMIEQIEALNKIASDFSKFAQPTSQKFKEIKVNELIHSVVIMYEEDHLNLSTKFDTREFLIMGVSDELRRVFVNLIKNAKEAISEEGSILLTTVWNKTSKSVDIKIIDNGVGISKEDSEHIFLPNFSTKTSGTGLGLAITKKIIEEHHGSISFESTASTGTTFTITLPLNNS